MASSHHAAPDQYQQKETADMAKYNTSTVPPVSLDEAITMHCTLAEWYLWRAENATLDSVRETYEEFAAQLTLRGRFATTMRFRMHCDTRDGA
jgi:hypothetical protein